MNDKKRNIIQRIRHTFSGQVQGVGFRPFIFQLAEHYKLIGSVKNTPEGVCLEVQGETKALSCFINTFFATLPPLARIDAHHQQDIPINTKESAFTIAKSTRADMNEGHNVLISPDIAVCEDCLHDVEQSVRRKNYAFTNCTNCGPRYSITQSLPYDRETTTMACFPLCPDCKAEYENAKERRFHAQPNACSVCGPTVWFTKDPARSRLEQATGEQAIASAVQCLCEGGIVALKGLGGFQLVCDAANNNAVTRLRYKKKRPDKPLAIMTDSLASAQTLACVHPIAAKWLTSSEKPITLCPIHKETFSLIVPAVAPRMQRIGIMLPYTPLHHLLLQSFIQRKVSSKAPALVMTSGNRSGEPIAIGNREAFTVLQDIAEAWLFHNRDILVRVDDSVVLPLDEEAITEHTSDVIFLRRARGFVPVPIALAPYDKKLREKKTSAQKNKSLIAHDEQAFVKNIEKQESLSLQGLGASSQEQGVITNLGKQERVIFQKQGTTFQELRVTPVLMGAGADVKNTFCLTKGANAFVSQHIGDMQTIETEAFYRATQKHITTLLSVSPEYIIRDLHPDYAVTRVAESLGLPCMNLQHHAAHAFSVLGENLFEGMSLVLTLDGTGFGDDGGLWGGEALIVDMQDGTWSRAGSLSDIPLPGGDIAVKEPWRIAHALMAEQGLSFHNVPWLPTYASTAQHIPRMLEKKLNTPYTSSCGRLFDAVSALLGICLSTTYEGQAAMLLEQAQWGDRVLEAPLLSAQASSAFQVSSLSLLPLPEEERYLLPICEKKGRFILDSYPMFHALCHERQKGGSSALLARKFHQSLAYGLCELAERLCRKNNLTHVGLSGGVMQNTTLLSLICKELARRGLTPLTHTLLPAGDGGLSFGQVVWGSIILRARDIEKKYCDTV